MKILTENFGFQFKIPKVNLYSNFHRKLQIFLLGTEGFKVSTLEISLYFNIIKLCKLNTHHTEKYTSCGMAYIKSNVHRAITIKCMIYFDALA